MEFLNDLPCLVFGLVMFLLGMLLVILNKIGKHPLKERRKITRVREKVIVNANWKRGYKQVDCDFEWREVPKVERIDNG